jgi:hypothetical protein
MINNMNKCGQDEGNEITPKGLGDLALFMQSPNHFQGSFMYMAQQCCVVVGFEIVCYVIIGRMSGHPIVVTIHR